MRIKPGTFELHVRNSPKRTLSQNTTQYNYLEHYIIPLLDFIPNYLFYRTEQFQCSSRWISYGLHVFPITIGSPSVAPPSHVLHERHGAEPAIIHALWGSKDAVQVCCGKYVRPAYDALWDYGNDVSHTVSTTIQPADVKQGTVCFFQSLAIERNTECMWCFVSSLCKQ